VEAIVWKKQKREIDLVVELLLPSSLCCCVEGGRWGREVFFFLLCFCALFCVLSIPNRNHVTKKEQKIPLFSWKSRNFSATSARDYFFILASGQLRARNLERFGEERAHGRVPHQTHHGQAAVGWRGEARQVWFSRDARLAKEHGGRAWWGLARQRKKKKWDFLWAPKKTKKS